MDSRKEKEIEIVKLAASARKEKIEKLKALEEASKTLEKTHEEVEKSLEEYTEVPCTASQKKSVELPKRPMAPHVRFFQEMAAECASQGHTITLSEATEIWRSMEEEDKQPFVHSYKVEKKNYNQAMKSYRKSLTGQGIDYKVLKKYTAKRLKKVFELNSGLHQKRALHKEKNPNLFYTLRVAVGLFLQELGKEVQEHLERKESDVITIDDIDEALSKKYPFIVESHFYISLLESLNALQSVRKISRKEESESSN
eukprot:TRINITY_DN4264_c0_g2_i2.p1 TRINITY_DN4264_c0_g2~~TRINITY_DN4264_c0_g2_i2.p1  ORF type:complete len:255 (+),score=76.48 TRINITY_DN4264_c0_g2_i2:93-857(+)